MAGALGLASGFTSGMAQAASKRPVVAELFTSQGCSSCPPADAIFHRLSSRQGLVTLTYHVDYWDYLGWRDTLASKDFSQRQYDYAKSRGDMEVYTPQAIINGRKHVVGSRLDDVETAIKSATAAPEGAWVDLAIEGHANDLTVHLPNRPEVKDATLWIVAVANSVEVSIGRGENAGRTVRYQNVVRKMSPAAMWNGEATKIMMPRATTVTDGSDACVALLQIGKAGPVIGVSPMRDLA